MFSRTFHHVLSYPTISHHIPPYPPASETMVQSLFSIILSSKPVPLHTVPLCCYDKNFTWVYVRNIVSEHIRNALHFK